MNDKVYYINVHYFILLQLFIFYIPWFSKCGNSIVTYFLSHFTAWADSVLFVAVNKSYFLVKYSHTDSIQFSSVAQLCLTLCNPMDCSMPGLPVHHQLPEFTQIHVHRVSDAIQPSHPLSSPSPPAPNPSQHQSLFQWVNSSHEVAKVLEFQL